MASAAQHQRYTQRDAFGEAGGWLEALRSAIRSAGPWKLIHRSDSPHLYYPSAFLYETREPFTSVDGMERIKYENSQPYECTISPDDGKFERLLVQAPKDICAAGNGTWNRTVIRNVSPLYLRVANLPFRWVHRSRRSDSAAYDERDWIKIVCAWPLAAAGILFYTFLSVFETSQPPSKDVSAYLPFHYKGYKYPLLAKNYKENRDVAALERLYDPGWLSSGVSYRPLRPRYLCFLQRDGVGFELRPVRAGEDVSYVFIAYTTEHFDCAPLGGNKASGDLKTLTALALMATRQCKKAAEERKERAPDAFWLAHLCTPHNRFADDQGKETVIDGKNAYLVQKLRNEDTYSISDVIRMAERVVIIAGNPSRKKKSSSANRKEANMEAIREWGSRAWTLPEILLSKGDSVTVCFAPQKPLQLRTVAKQFFPTLVWSDGAVSRQLIDHFSTLHLSRLELVNVAWECLMQRSVGMRKRFAGDLSYILMGLLRLRPPVDTTDSPFQAFGRLSLPQDSDRLMERLVMLLPKQGDAPPGCPPTSAHAALVPDRPWEEMTDQFNARLWDIYPDIQICGIGEADTIVVDGFKGALIKWDGLHPVRTATNLTLKRRLIMAASKYSFPLFLIAIILVSIPASRLAGIVLVVLSLILPLLSPIVIPMVYDGKLWGVEPCLFGIEGFVPLAEIERRLFGARLSSQRLRWSANFSPLSRHGPSPAGRERSQRYYDDEGLLLANPADGWRDTDLVQGKDPLLCDRCKTAGEPSTCPERSHMTYDEVRRRGHGAVGGLKIFTLIDTLSLTVTLFEARRPPVALLVGGSEGGMKRALACSYDMATGVLYRETVLRIPTTSVDHMHSVARVRLGLQRRFNDVVLRSKVRGDSAPPPGEATSSALPGPTLVAAPVTSQSLSNGWQQGEGVRPSGPWHPQSTPRRQQIHAPVPVDSVRPTPVSQTSSDVVRRSPPEARPRIAELIPNNRQPASQHPSEIQHLNTAPYHPRPIREAEQVRHESDYFGAPAEIPRQHGSQGPYPSGLAQQQQHSPSRPFGVDPGAGADVDAGALAGANMPRPAPKRAQHTVPPSAPANIPFAMEMQPLIQVPPTEFLHPRHPVSGNPTRRPQPPRQGGSDYQHHHQQQPHQQHQQNWQQPQQQQQWEQPQQQHQWEQPQQRQYRQRQQYQQGPHSQPSIPPDASQSSTLQFPGAPAYSPIPPTDPVEEEEHARPKVLQKRPPLPSSGMTTVASVSSMHDSVRSRGGSVSVSGTGVGSDATSLPPPWETVSLVSDGASTEWGAPEGPDAGEQAEKSGRKKLVKKRGLGGTV